MVIFVLALASLAAAVYFAAEAITVSSRERRTAVLRASTYGRIRRKALTLPDRGQLHQRAIVPLKDSVAKWVLRLTPKLSIEAVSAKLLAAGLTRRLTPTGFLALKGGAGAGVLL